MLSAVCLGLFWVPLEHELEYMYACAYLARSSQKLLSNTYEASPCQVGKQVPLTTAWSVIVPHCAFVSASHSIFASRRDAASSTLHQTPIEDHTRSRTANRVGRSLSPRPRSPFVPSCRPPHGVDLEGPLSPGSGEGQSEKQSRRDVERGSESARPIKRSELPDLRAHDGCLLALSGARGRRSLVRARSMGLSLDDGLTLPSLPQLTVATKRSISNALPRSRM
jgi:hypothetical protein